MSFCELFLEDVVNAASVFARPRKKGEGEVGELIGDEDGSENAGCDGDSCDISELEERERPVMGTVRELILISGGFSDDSAGVAVWPASSGSTSSAEGRGRPLATATNWYSVQDSEWSLSPLQNGAKRRSI